jgi:hypothetical protein
MVRLRITRQPAGCIDGIRLDNFVVGSTYDVGTMLGCYLLAEGLAAPVADDAPALVAPIARTRFKVIPLEVEGEAIRMRAPRWAEPVRSEAADRSPRRPRKPRKTRS